MVIVSPGCGLVTPEPNVLSALFRFDSSHAVQCRWLKTLWTACFVISLSMFCADSTKSASASLPGWPIHLCSHNILLVCSDVRRGSLVLFLVGMMEARVLVAEMSAVVENARWWEFSVCGMHVCMCVCRDVSCVSWDASVS